MDITIVDNPTDREEMKRLLDGHADMINGDISKEAWNDTEKYPRKQWLDFDQEQRLDFNPKQQFIIFFIQKQLFRRIFKILRQ